MGVKELEEIARQSQKENISAKTSIIGNLALQERHMGISVRDRISQIKRNYKNGPIIVADLGCFISTVAGDMNKIEGVESFGIDLHPYLDNKQKFYSNRLIVADLNNMPNIPNESFHYMMSYNVLTYTKIKKSIPEIFRIMKPGGIADLDIEFWDKKYIDDIMSMDLHKNGNLFLATSNFEGSIPEYAKYITDLEKKDSRKAGLQHLKSRFVLAK